MINNPRHKWEQRLVLAIESILEDGCFLFTETSEYFIFLSSSIIDVEYWNLRWRVPRHGKWVNNDNIFVNAKTVKLSHTASEKIGRMSSEYAVLEKMSQ